MWCVLSVNETVIMRRPWPTSGCCAMGGGLEREKCWS